MKKALLLFCLLWFGFTGVKAQWVTIPDNGFAAHLRYLIPNCMNGNLLDTTCTDIEQITSLSCPAAGSIEGIEYLHHLESFQCYNRGIDIFPVFPNSLKVISIGDNTPAPSFTSLPPSLEVFECYYSQLVSLPPLPNSLRELKVSNNDLIDLPPVLPDSLRLLFCAYNALTSLPEIPPRVSWVSCQDNLLTQIPELPDSLERLWSYKNRLTSLPELPALLFQLYCNSNNLTSLPPLPDSLVILECQANRLTTLPNLPESLEHLDFGYNLQLKCFPPMKRFLGTTFEFDNTGIKCFSNVIEHTAYLPQIDAMPICDLFNENGCEAAWNIQGDVYLDGNADCQKQSSEASLPVKVNLFQSGNLVQSVFSKAGGYSFDTELGIYTVAIDTTGLPFVVTCPEDGDSTLELPYLDSLKLGIDFGLVCKPGFDVGTWSIVGNRFRPAWEEQINIKAGEYAYAFGLHCAAAVSGSVSVVITGPAKYIAPAAGALTPSNVSANTLTYNIADFSSVNSSKDFNIIIRTDTTAQNAQQICFTVNVTPTTGDNNPGNNELTQCFSVRTSYDPNDKSVYPEGDILPEQDWLTYTIRFQNTGNDTAIHIQVMDTLDSDIDMASFKLLAYSHENITQILKGGVVKFNFSNIMLPDSHVNELLSHGYIQYKVKLKENLPIGTHISNTAYIYFDFNAPVVTNTTTNTITTPTGIASLAKESAIHIYPNPTTHELFIKANFNYQFIAIFDVSGRKMMEANYTSRLDITGLGSGVYFVEVKNGSEAIRKRWVKAN